MNKDNLPVSGQSEISQDTLDKLASREAAIRESGIVDIFEQNLKPIPADYIPKPRDRQFVEDTLHAVYDLIGGVRREALWAHQNPGEFYKLRARVLPEAAKATTQATAINIYNSVPTSPLDQGIYGEVTDIDQERNDD
jgi:hypothetical protein